MVQVPRGSLPGVTKAYLEEADRRSSEECTTSLLARWAYETNMTEHTRRAQVEALLKLSQWRREVGDVARSLAAASPQLAEEQRRRLHFLSSLDMAALPQADLEEYTNLKTKMMEMHSSARVCDFNDPAKCDLTFSSDLEKLMKTSRDYQELAHAWRAWRDNTGRRLRPQYSRLTTLANKAAKLNGFNSSAEEWLAKYDTSGNFTNVLTEVFQQLAPLYQQLHAYVRRKLRQQYGETHITEKGPIPTHLLGNMCAQHWDEIYPLVEPFPGNGSLNVTQEMEAQGYTVRQMFEAADDFFVSLGLPRMPASFWRKSFFVKPSDRNVSCEAAAWDFCNGKDYRVKMCSEVNMKDLLAAHHSLGVLHYYVQYRHLPHALRQDANPAFHEAVGGSITLSAGSPSHLYKLGLLKNLTEDSEVEINHLMKVALHWIPFISSSYVLDLWRWDISRTHFPDFAWNCAWWDLRFQLQGLKPPVLRTEKDLDAAASNQVIVDTEYIRNYVSTVLQFQFHKALCLKAGQYDPLDPAKPLHKCDVYQSVAAGDTLKAMLSLGRSKPWQVVLGVMTGEPEGRLDTSAMLEYFKPLEEWLTLDNAEHGEHVGWHSDGEYCKTQGPPMNQ